MGIRYDITNEQVKELYEKFGSKMQVARALNCSIRLVWNALAGDRPNPSLSPVDTLKLKGEKVKICECCGFRPIWEEEGLRKLCKLCFKYRDCGNAVWNYVDHS